MCSDPDQPRQRAAGTGRLRCGTLRTAGKGAQQLGSTHALVLHSEDGLDEISIATPLMVLS